MESATEQLTVKDKNRLLLTLMEALAGDAHLSSEGDLHGFRLMEIAGAGDQETTTLKRNTHWPQQDFIVVPLEPATVRSVFSAIGGNVPRRILHAQIEKRSNLAFGAYDQFQAGCVFFGPAVNCDLLNELVSSGVLSQGLSGAGR
jgi:hypothetical protein